MERIQKLQAVLCNKKLDCFFTNNIYHLRYLAHFTGTDGYVLITQTKQFLFVDYRYKDQAEEQVRGLEVVLIIKSEFFKSVISILEAENIHNVGLEDTMTYHLFMKLKKNLFNNIDVVVTSGLVETLREIKDESEIATIQKACEITDKAFSYILGVIKPGISEIEVANKLDFFMRNLGATEVSFSTIVASGLRSVMPHGVASDKKIGKREIVTLDFGCYYQGYVSDMTRTIFVGEPDPLLKEIYSIVLEAQERAIAFVKDGVSGRDYDGAAREFINKKGYGDQFFHGVGHGIGLEIHEAPSLSIFAPESVKLKTGQVVTAEPGIYISELGGVRIEDDLVVTKDGARMLTQSPKELIIL
ncbi:MAG: aminopeptidase P family protein [Lactobacillales bacterium]|jgi:Xaa-Pro aminopeptidase|nr:aminopeptidase P family protein [Lactobacillales bacterium]